jgi:catechol 2,3-dioxygenase-like lactoylglutathione lyase family enzyme
VRFHHVHLNTTDLDSVLDLPTLFPGARTQDLGLFAANTILVADELSLTFFGPSSGGIPETITPTDDHPIGHLAFSYPDLDRARARLEEAGVEIEGPTEERAPWGFRSFFVRGPDQVLLELVEADGDSADCFEPSGLTRCRPSRDGS